MVISIEKLEVEGKKQHPKSIKLFEENMHLYPGGGHHHMMINSLASTKGNLSILCD